MEVNYCNTKSTRLKVARVPICPVDRHHDHIVCIIMHILNFLGFF